MTSERPVPDRRESYRHFHRITTRWMDNDAYGHVNNVVYYSWFDTVVNEYLIRQGVLDITGGQVADSGIFLPMQHFDTIVAVSIGSSIRLLDQTLEVMWDLAIVAHLDVRIQLVTRMTPS